MSSYATTTRRISTSGLVYVTIQGGVVELLRSGGRGCRMALHWQEDGPEVHVTEQVARVPNPAAPDSTLSRPRASTAVVVDLRTQALGDQPQVPVQIYVPDETNVILDHTSAVTARRVSLASLKATLGDGQALSWQRASAGASVLYLDDGAIVTTGPLADVDLTDGVEGGVYTLGKRGIETLDQSDGTREQVEATFRAITDGPLYPMAGSLQ